MTPTETILLQPQREGVIRSSAGLDVRRASQTSLFKDGRLLVWFSCGAASACALKLVAHMNPIAVYCDTSKDEHEDNLRFRKEVEEWTGVKVTVIKSRKYSSIEEVADDVRYMAGPKGAPCTGQMKKVPRFEFQRPDDIHIFGMTVDELDRIEGFESDNFDLNLAWPLLQAGMEKQDCLDMIAEAGIGIPVLYLQGFENNNCIGCFKATGVAYWNRVRKYYPAVFKRRCEQSRRLNVRLVRYKGERIFLDELPEDATDNTKENLSCGPQCGEARTSNNQAQAQPPTATPERKGDDQ